MTTMNGGGDDNNDNNDHNKQQPQIDDAKNFLERVKETFKNTKGVYDRFVEIMKNFKHDRLNTGGVIKEVQDLFSGHEELFVGFQNFLPAAGLVTQDELREIQQTMNSSNRNGGTGSHGNGHNNNNNNNVNPDFNMAVTFICKIKQRFGSHRRIYQEFLQILQHFQTAAQANDTSVIKNVKNRIRALFREHPDLLDQFDYFLPPLTAHFSRQSALMNSSAPNQNDPDSIRMNGRKRRADSDLENQPDTKRRRQDENDKRRRNNNKSKGDNDAWQPKSEREPTRDRIQTRSRSNRDKHKRRKNKNRSHDKSHTNNNTRDDRDSDIDDDEITFSDGISDNDDHYGHNNSNNNNHNINRHNDNNDSVGDEHQGLRIFSKLRKDIPDHLYKHVLTLTQLYPMGLTEFSVVGKLICDALREHGHTELMKEFQKELSSSKQSWFFRSRGQNYYEYLTNNILLKSCKAVQSSYRQLPTDVVQPRCSGRHPDAAKTLNDHFVSKPTGGENQPNGEGVNTAGGRLKNMYNENLQKSEDDLFELDMMIATNDAARKRLEQLYKTVMQPKNLKHINASNKAIEIPPVEKRAISRLYSEHGNKVLNLLKKMPETTIPVVLKRLREKSNEWQQLKNEMKAVWKSVANKNYFKAHDFRYTIFKQYDTKRITLKNICKQIEERHVMTNRRLDNMRINAQNTQNTATYTNGKQEQDDDIVCDEDENENENQDIDIDIENNENEGTNMSDDVPDYKLQFDSEHDSKSRRIDRQTLDFIETNIANTNGGVIINGNGVLSGVGLIGNASHDHIIQQMGAGLHVELGNYMYEGKHKKINNYDYRFVICKQDILRDCARFVFQHANTSEVGKEKKEKKLFAEILESIFKEFFKMNISEQSTEFLQNDIDSDDDDDDDDEFDDEDNNNNKVNNNNHNQTPIASKSRAINTSNSSSMSMTTSPDPISKIMRCVDVYDENMLNSIDLNQNNENNNVSIRKYLFQYYDENNNNDNDNDTNDNILILGNKTVYALFRYLHFLYSRMNFAYKLCKSENPLYGNVETNEEIQRKYKDFLSHLSKLINGQIEEEIFEDECRKLLGIKSYELFTISKVIRYVYDRICDFDTDEKLHQFYKLFLAMKQQPNNKENMIKYYIKATQISNTGNKPDELYQVAYFDNKILCISLSDKYTNYSKNTNNTNISPSQTSNNNNNNNMDIKMSENNTKK